MAEAVAGVGTTAAEAVHAEADEAAAAAPAEEERVVVAVAEARVAAAAAAAVEAAANQAAAAAEAAVEVVVEEADEAEDEAEDEVEEGDAVSRGGRGDMFRFVTSMIHFSIVAGVALHESTARATVTHSSKHTYQFVQHGPAACVCAPRTTCAERGRSSPNPGRSSFDLSAAASTSSAKSPVSVASEVRPAAASFSLFLCSLASPNHTAYEVSNPVKPLVVTTSPSLSGVFHPTELVTANARTRLGKCGGVVCPPRNALSERFPNERCSQTP